MNDDNNRQVTNDEEIHKVNKCYANWVSIESNLFDVNLQFGQNNTPDNGDSKVPLAQIIMSPQHAKVLGIMLMQNIRNYEEKFGKINIPQMEQDNYGGSNR